jgi:signal transduction histidine kinase/AmiR/NasT family two-component response regulator/HPt (histidine-containing phosphotransfer) domain-containing protein
VVVGGAGRGLAAVAVKPDATRSWHAPGARAPGRRTVALAAGVALVLGGLVTFGGLLERPQTAWHDLQARLFAPAGPARGVLVVDIDEPSVQALRPQFGGWPPNRDLLATVTAHLLRQGARAVAIDLVLADPREGDDSLVQVMAAHPGRVVLATSVLPAQSMDATAADTPAAPGCPAHPWAAMLLPAPSLLAAVPRLGMVSTPTDADGQLRALPLWHAAADRAVPALPLAALLAAQAQDAAALRCADGELAVGKLRVPLDAQGRVRPALRVQAAAVARRAYEAVVRAALGQVPDDTLRGQLVFIGASAGLGERAQTPLGPRWGPALLAETAAALENGELVTPPRPAQGLAWLLLACVPALLAWRRGGLRPAADLPWVAATALAMVTLDGGLYAALRQQSHLAGPVTVLAAFALGSLLQGRRAMREEHLRLESERAAAEAASHVKSEFLAHMSHEIRTPMNALLGSAELLAQTALDERQGRHVALFQAAGASLVEILNDLLDLSKIEAGLLELHPQPFSLVDLVASQTVLFEARAAQKGLTLLTEFDPELPPAVHGDGPRLAQVLRNLLGNAVKFTHRGSVTLAVRRVPGAPGRLRFEVRDTGIGIAPDRQQEIFLAFTQGDSGVARAYGGTGLGLTISHRLVALMAGHIGVDSREGEGATFHLEVDLPATREAPVALWAPSAPEAAGEMRQGLSLLLADDNPHNVQLVLAYLEGDGHRIDVVHDGEAAVQRFRANRYDAVLMDVQMPGMDGYRATAALRALERERGDDPVPVIALTANAMPDDARRSLQAGCTAHLSKPFSRVQLRRALAGRVAADERATPPLRPEVAAFADAPAPLPVLAALPGFDLATALARMDGDLGLYLRVLHASVGPLGDWEARFSQCLDGPDPTAALRLAHDLKSTAATVGAEALSRAAQRLEAHLREPARDPARGTDAVWLAERAEAHRQVRPLLASLLAALA